MDPHDNSSSSYPLHIHSLPYAHDHALQTLDICLPRALSSSPPSQTIWLVFLHGGAWVDPSQDKAELRPALDLFLRRSCGSSGSRDNNTGQRTADRIAGFASINYGLSPRPGEDRSRVPPHRAATHPSHLQDVLAALAFLRTTYNVGDDGDDNNGGQDRTYDWILAGHSCGATMLFQLAMRLLPPAVAGPSGFGVGMRRPRALVGIAGLYDLPLLVSNHEDQPFYRQFVTSAFGPGVEVWRSVSPAEGKPEGIVGGVKTVVVAHSEEDELVEVEQGNEFVERLKGVEGGGEKVVLLELQGGHDELWEKGEGVVRALTVAVERVFEME